MTGPEIGLSGEAVGLVARNAPAYFRAFFDLVAEGAVVVPLRSADDGFRRAVCGIRRVVVPDAGFGWIAPTGTMPAGPEIAQIAFTSGTQGEPKGVILTRDNLADVVERLRAVMGLDATIREYVGVPIHHSFGFGRCRAVAAVGGRAYVPERGFDPREIRAMLEAGEINAVSAVPSLWRILLRNGEILAPVADRVRWIEIGSQPMSREDKLGMLELFPAARIVQHYGLTEASRTTFLDLRAATAAEIDSVGAPNGAAEVAIDPEGRIRIRGRHVAAELLVGGARVSNVDAEGWFVTQDLGRIDGGKLRFLGRADDMLNLSGIKISADLLEARVGRALGVEGEICVVRIADPDRGDGVLLAVKEACAASNERLARAAADALAEQGVAAAATIRVARFPDFPTTDTGKVRRFALAEAWAVRVDATPGDADGLRPAAADRSGRLRRWIEGRVGPRGEADVPAIFARCFPGRDIRPGDSFVSLGGDSLTFVEASTALGGVLGDLPEGWQDMTMAELRAIHPERSGVRRVDTTLMLRFVGIVAIVTYHFTPLYVGGATFLLMVLAGYNFSRFQVENALGSDRVGPMLVSTLRIVLPVWLVSVAIQARHQEFDLMHLLLVSNFRDAAAPDLDYWFVEALVQILVAMTALFALPAARRAARAGPFAFALGAVAVGAAGALAGPLVWDTTHLFDRAPHMVFWMFALGWVLHRAPGLAGRALGLALAFVLPLAVWGIQDWPFWVANGPWWIWAGCLLLVFFEKLPAPFPVDRLAYLIGGASLFIYVTHWSVQGIWHRVTPVEWSALDVLVALAVGVAVWLAWDAGTRRATRWIRHRWSLFAEARGRSVLR